MPTPTTIFDFMNSHDFSSTSSHVEQVCTGKRQACPDILGSGVKAGFSLSFLKCMPCRMIFGLARHLATFFQWATVTSFWPLACTISSCKRRCNKSTAGLGRRAGRPCLCPGSSLHRRRVSEQKAEKQAGFGWNPVHPLPCHAWWRVQCFPLQPP